MGEAIPPFSLMKPCNFINHTTKSHPIQFSRSVDWKSCGRRLSSSTKMKASLTDLAPLMAVLVEHMEGQRDLITHKTIWHLSDQAIKNVYTLYIMFTCWGCCFFGSMKDPFYDSEAYRKDGGDGSGHWVYDKQEDMEERARAELWREELIEEIEQKVGGLRELEDPAPAQQDKLAK